MKTRNGPPNPIPPPPAAPPAPLPPLDPKLDVLLKIYEKLCAIHEQLKTEVVIRDKCR